MKLLASIICAIVIIPSLAIRESSRPRHDRIVSCYLASWAQYRPGKGQFQIDNLHPEHCTHIIYSFAGLNATTWTIRSLDPWADLEENYGKGSYKKITDLRRTHQGLKVSLAIGGWNEASANYSALAASPQRRNVFVTSVINFLTTYNFDGLDLDWEFPGKRGGSPYDRQNFVSLVEELSKEFKPRNLLLTAAISADKSTIDIAYNVPEISKYLDLIHVMAYDYHGAWDGKVGANAPLKCSNNDSLCVESTIDYLLQLGAPADKLVLGLPMYGRTFVTTSILNDTQSPMGAIALKNGFQGNFTREDGFMGYNEICKELIVNPKSWRTGWDHETNSAFAIHDDKVVVYDNPKSIMKKIEYVKQKSLAGVMVWSIDTDDFRGECKSLHTDLDPLIGSEYPLMRAINIALTKTQTDDNEIPDNANSSSAIIYYSGLSLLQLIIFIILK
ncbi:probable chitinase 2 [Microplitis demolitor]|uniref:probable chitinase 2 n=1 Tax=Microplitis demolitor TaxID=69319 RepID=UPI0004CD4F58|nr:probable chitinase 2 [Microplitis demolitor]